MASLQLDIMTYDEKEGYANSGDYTQIVCSKREFDDYGKTLKQNEEFTETELPSLGRVTIFDVKAKHITEAMRKSQGQPSQMTKYLIIEVALVDYKRMSEIQFNNMDGKDFFYLLDAVNMMIEGAEMGEQFKL